MQQLVINILVVYAKYDTQITLIEDLLSLPRKRSGGELTD
jgi:hypothetical protein